MKWKENRTEAVEWLSDDGLVCMKRHDHMMPKMTYGAHFAGFSGAFPSGYGATMEEALQKLLESIPGEIKKLEDLQAKLKEALNA